MAGDEETNVDGSPRNDGCSSNSGRINVFGGGSRKSLFEKVTPGRHDGRGLGFLSVLFRKRGSIIARTLPVAFLSAMFSSALMICEATECIAPEMLPILRHPIGVQMLGIVLGYCTVLRTNIAISRYFEGMTNVQFCSSKWSDAYTQLSAFIRSSIKLHRIANKDNCEDVVLNLCRLQRQLLHWFSILHALAVNALQVTQLDLDDDEFNSRIRVLPLPKLSSLMQVLPQPDNWVAARGNPDQLAAAPKDKADGPAATDKFKSFKPQFTSAKTLAFETSDSEASPLSKHLACLPVLGPLTKEEMLEMDMAESKIDLVHAWIIEAIAEASLDGRLLTQPPILSRVYQELSNGMLGYNQAYKLALVQFPFAFAQMLTMFLVAFMFCCPIVVYVFTGGELLTPALTLFTVLGFWGIHEIAVEVENPFGLDINHLPLIQLHATVTDALVEVTLCKMPPFG